MPGRYHTGSTAAFTATTRNAGNSWATGQVALTDDDAGRAGFTVENLVPGATGEKCIEVTSNSTVAGEVRAYTQNLSGSAAGLQDHIDLRVERGTGGSFDNCDDFSPVPGALPAQSLSTLAQVNNDYATGGARPPGTPLNATLSLKERARATMESGYRAFRMGAGDVPIGAVFDTRTVVRRIEQDCRDVREAVERWAGEGATATATIRLRRDSGYPLRARAVVTTPVDAEWDELEVPYGHGLEAWLAEFGPDVVVVAPEELRSEVLDRLRAVAKG